MDYTKLDYEQTLKILREARETSAITPGQFDTLVLIVIDRIIRQCREWWDRPNPHNQEMK